VLASVCDWLVLILLSCAWIGREVCGSARLAALRPRDSMLFWLGSVLASKIPSVSVSYARLPLGQRAVGEWLSVTNYGLGSTASTLS